MGRNDDEKIIKELELKLAQKENEIQRYRIQIREANLKIEELIESVTLELEMAHRIQKLLSPVEIPKMQGFEFSTKFIPGSRFGGDYFDLFDHEDKYKFGILLVSASGYTMSSLLMTILLKVSTQVEARKGLEPHELIRIFSQEVGTQIREQDSASIFYGVMDRRSNTLKYCSVGNLEAYVQVQGRDHLMSLDSSGAELSRNFNISLHSSTLVMNPDDRLVLVTEGLIRAKNDKNQFWGSEGVRDALRYAAKNGVHELRNEILFRCEEFSGQKIPVRDQTVIVMEAKDRAVKLTSL